MHRISIACFSTVLKLGIIFAAIVCGYAGSAMATGDLFKSAINDPVFGHYFDTGQASFDRVPFSSLGKACLRFERDFYLTSRHSPVYLYGKYAHERAYIWIIGINDGASLFVRRGDHCARSNPVIAFRQNFSPMSRRDAEPVMSKSEIVDVFSDLLVRFDKAFGGKERFFRWVDDYTDAVQRTCSDVSRLTCPPTWHSLPNYLQDMVSNFRK